MNFFEDTDIHEHSVKIYNTRLNQWISFMPPIYQSLTSIISFPEHSMKILEDNLTTNTNTNKHTYIVAILSFLRHKRSLLTHLTTEQYASIRVKWIDINNENEAPIIQRRLENKPTEIQLKKGGAHLDFNHLVSVRNKLPEGSIERLLISMYTMIPPPRSDLFATQIVYDDEVPIEKNYIRFRSDSTAQCILTDFKTVKTYKQITHDLPPELIHEIETSLNNMPRNYLFINANGKPHTRNSFTVWTSRLLSKVFEVKYTLIFFRHAFVTHFITTVDMNTITDAQIKEISDRMGHSTEMFRAYKWVKSGMKGELTFEDEKNDE
jgi:hypothetical protein